MSQTRGHDPRAGPEWRWTPLPLKTFRVELSGAAGPHSCLWYCSQHLLRGSPHPAQSQRLRRISFFLLSGRHTHGQDACITRLSDQRTARGCAPSAIYARPPVKTSLHTSPMSSWVDSRTLVTNAQLGLAHLISTAATPQQQNAAEVVNENQGEEARPQLLQWSGDSEEKQRSQQTQDDLTSNNNAQFTHSARESWKEQRQCRVEKSTISGLNAPTLCCECRGVDL